MNKYHVFLVATTLAAQAGSAFATPQLMAAMPTPVYSGGMNNHNLTRTLPGAQTDIRAYPMVAARMAAAKATVSNNTGGGGALKSVASSKPIATFVATPAAAFGNVKKNDVMPEEQAQQLLSIFPTPD